ncbi:M23 family metallopeptidase [Paraburkholderia dilworthii]|uniref:M23 family metallopeptidase n=1 Tax=Paraburkholderia dilworthii TaxID=948106 RepID=UPI0004260387|nr:M23 family metallopeptidase [Paraburkholderia dilworthii]
MIISPPFLPQTGLNSSSDTGTDAMMTAVEAYEPGYHGVFPVTFDRRWHGGIHLVPHTLNEPVRAIADGEVVAYRISQNPISDGHIDEATGQEALNTNNGFVLLRHVTDTGDGRTLTFYSLYMHLLDLTAQHALTAPQPANPPQNSSPFALAPWLLEVGDGVKQGNGRKVYRKDILGHWGQSQGLRHLHFEIFMTGDDFTAWFEQPGHAVQLGEKNPAQPTSMDWWGHAYYVIPGTVEFLDRPRTPHDETWFPRLNAGRLAKENSKLYVEAYFHKGQRYTRAWMDENGDGNCVPLTPRPIGDPYNDYEYKLYERAMALYPTCPSDGYELLRFGRILSHSSTLASALDRTTWVAVPFDADGTQGYVDINGTSIVKLSDADFPFFTGWQKLSSENALLDADGLFSYRKLRQLVGDATASAYDVSQTDQKFSLDEQLSSYVQGNDDVRNGLSGLVCHTKSEWDSANNDERYQNLNKPDGYFGKCKDTDPDGYDRFEGFLKKIQFMDHVPALAGGNRFRFFHPLAFIRHFRKCKWIGVQELGQLIPARAWLNQSGSSRAPLSNTLTSSDVVGRISHHLCNLNNTIRKYSLDGSSDRMAAFLAQTYIETDRWKTFAEYGHGAPNPGIPMAQYYTAFYGRGVMQLTWAGAYEAYGNFAKMQDNQGVYDGEPRITETSLHYWDDPTQRDSHGHIIGLTGVPKRWAPRYNPQLLASNSAVGCDSGGFFWIWKHHDGTRNISRVADSGITEQTIDRVNKLVNGGSFGYFERFVFSWYTKNIFTDWIPTAQKVDVTTPRQHVVVQIDLSRPG